MASSTKEAKERTCTMFGDDKMLCSSSNELDILGTNTSSARHVLVIFRVLCFRNRAVDKNLGPAACSYIGDKGGSSTCDSLGACMAASDSRSCSPWLREQPAHWVQMAGTPDCGQVRKAYQNHFEKHLSVEARQFAS